VSAFLQTTVSISTGK